MAVPGPASGRLRPPVATRRRSYAICSPPSSLDKLPLGVDGTGADPQPEGDALLGVVVGGLDQLVLEARLSAQVLLRQWRTVVGRLGLGADQIDRAVEPSSRRVAAAVAPVREAPMMTMRSRFIWSSHSDAEIDPGARPRLTLTEPACPLTRLRRSRTIRTGAIMALISNNSHRWIAASAICVSRSSGFA